jgi:2-oxoglutarate ferredoxin oxidoreductase subunit beta
MLSIEDYHLFDPTWCRGCGIFGLFSALKKAVHSLAIKPENISLVTGIGCHGRLNNYFNAYGFHGLHGRAIPLASGVKIANPKLSVIAVSGDGDAYSIGLGHFIHALRRNNDLTYLVVNNRIYGLTQGQTSPTSRQNFVSPSTPYGSQERPLDGLQLALAAGGTFIARGYSGSPQKLTSLITAALQHKGFSLVEVLSPCVTHNRVDTYEWFKSHLYDVDVNAGYNPSDKKNAWRVISREGKFPVGQIYKEERPSFEELSLPGKKPLAFMDLNPDVDKIDKILEKYKD